MIENNITIFGELLFGGYIWLSEKEMMNSEI